MSKRAERRWCTQKVVNRRKFFAQKIYFGTIPEDRIGKVLGRCRTMHPYDCGRPNCGICQYDKQCDIQRVQDIRSDLDFKEQIQ